MSNDELYAFMVVDNHGNDMGFVDVIAEDGESRPGAMSDVRAAEQLMPLMDRMAQANHMNIRLVKYSNREIIKEVQYEKPN